MVTNGRVDKIDSPLVTQQNEIWTANRMVEVARNESKHLGPLSLMWLNFNPNMDN